jgi:glycosyltransferase involved in cell wall biosynthesis
MKILEVSDSRTVGGASIAANRICSCLQMNGVEIHRLSSDSPNENSPTESTLFFGRKFLLLQNLLSYFNKNEIIDKLYTKEILRQFKITLAQTNPKIIHFHNIHSANWPIEIVYTALLHSSVAWTLHDCWSFLGSYYPSHSPAPTKEIARKQKIFWSSVHDCSNNLTAIAPSEWIKDQASDSFWPDKAVKKIHNPIPKSFFDTKDRLAAKRILGLNDEKPAVLCVSGNLSEERKGGPILHKILESKSLNKIQFIVCGGSFDLSHHSNVVRLGYVQDELTLKIAYAAADLLLHPAPVDNFPNTVAESLSCGTPVLAFKTGGLPEMVLPSKSGWLVDEICFKAMINKLQTIIREKSFEELRGSTKATARKLFNEETIAKEYSHVFQQIISLS